MTLFIGLLSAACSGGGAESAAPGDAWSSSLVEPAALAKELASANKPVILCTAPTFMYHAGHIPGAVLHGPMSEPKVHDELVAWAQPLPRNTRIVVYCGCCPLDVCPNVRPAFKQLKEMGFTDVRVLNLATNFPTDWTGHDYPVER